MDEIVMASALEPGGDANGKEKHVEIMTLCSFQSWGRCRTPNVGAAELCSVYRCGEYLHADCALDVFGRDKRDKYFCPSHKQNFLPACAFERNGDCRVPRKHAKFKCAADTRVGLIFNDCTANLHKECCDAFFGAYDIDRRLFCPEHAYHFRKVMSTNVF